MKKQPLIATFKNAFHGVFFVLKNERNFQIDCVALFLNIILMIWLPMSFFEISLIFIVCFIVLITEILNTGIEKICDFIQPNYHKKIGIIKDMAAGACVMAALLAVIVGIYVYSPYVRFFWSVLTNR